jgi:hypothetical protein
MDRHHFNHEQQETGITNGEFRLHFSFRNGDRSSAFGEKRNSNMLKLPIRSFFKASGGCGPFSLGQTLGKGFDKPSDLIANGAVGVECLFL